VVQRRRRLLDGLSNTAAGAVGSAAGLVLTIVIAHQLGLRALGEYAVIGTVYGLISVVDGARIQDLTARYAADGSNESRRFRVSLFLGGVGVCVVGSVAFGTVTDTRGAEGALIAWLGAVAQMMTAEAVASTQVRGKFQRLAVANIAGSVVGCAVAAVLVTRYGLLALGVGLFITSALPRVLLLLDRDARARFHRPPADGARAPSGTLSLTLLGSAAQLVNFTDVIALRSLASPADVGVYRAGSQVPTALVGLIYRGFDVLMARLAAASETDAARLLRREAPYLAVVVGASSGLVIGLRGPIVRAVLGHHNHQAETVLWLFAVVWVANSLIHPASLLLIARRRQAALVRLVTLEYVANLVLTVALVPAFTAVGSAVATLITLTVSNLVFVPRILARELPELAITRHLLIDCALPTTLAVGIAIGVATLATH
jgi:O-antigen/teichoic acid export membrane protein